MKIIWGWKIFLVFFASLVVFSEEEPKQKSALTLLTLFNGNIVTDEAIARFVRRAVFNGFEQSTSLRIIETSKSHLESTATPEVIKYQTIASAIKKHAGESSSDQVLLYVENTVTLVLSSPSQILETFKTFNTRVLLSTDSTPCFGDSVNAVANGTVRYANFAGFIGYVTDLARIFSTDSNPDSIPDLFSRRYGNPDFQMSLDTNMTLFYSIPRQASEVNLALTLRKDDVFLFPQLTTKNPKGPIHILQSSLCRHGNSVTYLNSLGSYLTPTVPEDKIELPDDDDLPVVALSIFVEMPTPFMEEFFENIFDLDYPKDKIHLFLHNHYRYNAQQVESYLNRTKNMYQSVKFIPSPRRVKEWAARTLAMEWALETKADYWFSVDSTAHLDEEMTLKNLIADNKLIISPMLCHQTDYLPNLCNFWGSLSADGFYAKASDFDDIAEDRHKGIWNVPFITSAYLIKRSVLEDEGARPIFVDHLNSPDLAFAQHNRNRSVYMHLTNEFHPGHLVNNDYFELGHKNDELYQIFDNRYDWDNRYIHVNYTESLRESFVPLEPCRDVYWFPIVTDRFATEMIEEMENNGNWADGSIEARGDLYPTVDIQMNEIGFEREFHEFLRLYISPLQEKVFKDYEVYPPTTTQAFVVRYSAEDQRELKPHFDESTYTLNIALNTPRKDFEGGGCRFTRFNCSVVDTRLGWGFLHPGQFTHKHEGLKVTNGTRYILVSFVDPQIRDDD